MATWIALLRGINVGGHNKLPMKDLKALLAQAGCFDVRTYIQSGNAVFDCDIDDATRFGEALGAAIEKAHGFCPAVHLLTADSLVAAIAANPYPDAEAEPKTLHLMFMAASPLPERVDRAHGLLAASEQCRIIDNVLYLHAPDGLANSKFASRVSNVLGVSTTARNWNTVTKLAALAAG